MKTVGNRRASADTARLTPQPAPRQAWVLPPQTDKLNPQGARDLNTGGPVCLLHRRGRTPEALEGLITPTEANGRRVLTAWSQLAVGVARACPPRRRFEKARVKCADEGAAEFSPPASEVPCPEAAPTAQRVAVDGVPLPFLIQNLLLASKEPRRKPDADARLGLRELRRCLAGLGAA